MTVRCPILQIGTSRFLLAHADLFVAEAMARGEALGPIAVVQTTNSPESARRVAALAAGGGYPVRIRGVRDGRSVDEERRGTAVARAFQAARDWAEVRRIAVEEAEVVLSNTGDGGFALDAADTAAPGADDVPVSFPAKLAALLHARWLARPTAPLSIFPCELISRNGDRLRELVLGLAARWELPAAFRAYVGETVRWANALVDRIVSEPIDPVGAVAEPYALWAIERQEGLVLPCRHPAIVVTHDLARFERLKLHLLNLGHTVLAEGWLRERRAPDELVREAMADAASRGELEAVWTEEVLPVFAAQGLGPAAERYLVEVRERFANPFLAHRLFDIAKDHAEKKRRRFGPVIAEAERLGLPIIQARLKQALA